MPKIIVLNCHKVSRTDNPDDDLESILGYLTEGSEQLATRQNSIFRLRLQNWAATELIRQYRTKIRHGSYYHWFGSCPDVDVVLCRCYREILRHTITMVIL